MAEISFLCFLVLESFHFSAAAENAEKPDTFRELSALPMLTVLRTATAPAIDGDISDAVWKQAACISGLLPACKANAKADLEIQPTTVRERNINVATP